MGILNTATDKLGNQFKETLTNVSIKKEATENLTNAYTLGMDAMFDASSNMTIETLQSLGISNYDTILKLAKLKNSTYGKYASDSKLLGKVTEGISSVTNWIDTAVSWEKNLTNMFVGQVYKRDLKTTPPSARDSTIGVKDPISRDVDIKERVYNIVERCGYAQDKVLSIGYSRNYIFTKRPLLAADASGQYKSYVFFTRPNCNLINKNEGMLSLNSQLLNYDSLFSLMSSDPKLYSELCRDGADQSNLFMLLSNYVKEIPPIRLGETERDGIQNMYKYSTPAPGVPEYHNVEASVTFNDNSRGDIAKLLYALAEYRHNVSKRGYAMRPEYIKNRADDTLISMYMVTCTADMEIVGFGVGLNGVITDVPSHFTQHRQGGFNKEELLDNFNITIKFSTYYPHAPKYFDYFNNIFGFNPADVVDVRGTNVNMVAPGRTADTSTSGRSSRAYLFGSDFGTKLSEYKSSITGVLTTAQDKINKVNKVVDTAKSILLHADSFGTVENMLSTGSAITNNAYTDLVTYNYKGVFEFLAKHPGVFAATSQNPLESGRVIYKLGFSY